MPWRPHGRATVNPSAPSAWGICDRCNFTYNLSDLKYQYEWMGPRLGNTRFKVCDDCLDTPFIFNKPLIIPPDPVPVIDPRQNQFAQQENTPVVENWDEGGMWDNDNQYWDGGP